MNGLILNGINFGKVFCAPGARGFFGEGYPFHRLWQWFGMTWSGTTLACKTTTLEPLKGNLPLGEDGITPLERRPRCIVAWPWSGHVLNAVGLSRPGAKALLADGRWQRNPGPFFLSFMAVGKTLPDRLTKMNYFVKLLGHYLPLFTTYSEDEASRVGLQINLACPNVGLHSRQVGELVSEAEQMLDIAAALNIPLVLNFNALTPVEVLWQSAQHPDCAALWIANTIPWGSDGIDWKRQFGSEVSPLEKRGLSPGGLSGPACLPLTIAKVKELRSLDKTIPIVAGNGIQSPTDVQAVAEAGANAIAIGVVGMVRPWRMQAIIDEALAV